MKLSLRMVVIGGVVVGLLVPLTAATVYTGESEAKRLFAESKEAHERITQVVAIGVQKALWDLAPEGAAPLVTSVMGDRRVVRAAIYDAQGAVFHEAKEEGRRAGEVLTLDRPVVNGDQVIGKVVVEFSLADAAMLVHQHLMETLVVAALQAAVCIAILVLLLNRRVLARVEALKKQAQKLAAKSLEEPFVWRSGDEIAELGGALELTRGALKGLFAELEANNAHLAGMNANLEGLVAERTATIKMIMDNVRSGFMLISTKFEVQAGYSRSCETLFGRTTIAGEKLTTALGLEPEAAEHFELCVAQVFDDIMPEEVSLEQIPRRARLDNRTLAVEGATVRNATGGVETILFTVTDVTELDKVESENRSNRSMIRILQNIAAFREFVKESRGRLEDAQAAAERSDEVVVRRELHTLKGNMAAFGLDELAVLVHKIEGKPTISVDDVVEVTDGLKEFLAMRRDMLGVRYTENGSESVSVAKEAFGALATKTAEFAMANIVHDWIVDVRKVPVSSMLGPVADYLERVATARGKIVQFSVKGGGLRVDAEAFKPIVQNLIHLLRNAVDHGIEAAVDRGEKDSMGTLELLFAEVDGRFEIRVKDDGRGIDASRVRASAVKAGRLSPEVAATMDDERSMDLIFLDGLTTTEVVSEISGRGVGMSAVREAVLMLGGSVKVLTRLGKGTEIVIAVPLAKAAVASKVLKAG